ncbi:MAG: universal stress protein [Gammaproteobacteria bacterium]|nr:MAG: universal stress protein [Gammaproteobacteria bacterium]
MSTKIIAGLEGATSGDKALAHAHDLAKMIGDCELIVVYVIEWSPFTFQTPEENAERHKRREEEIATAQQRVIDPALEALKADGISACGVVRHGNVAVIIEQIAEEESAQQIIVARKGTGGGLRERLMGSTASDLAMHSHRPVTVV